MQQQRTIQKHIDGNVAERFDQTRQVQPFAEAGESRGAMPLTKREQCDAYEQQYEQKHGDCGEVCRTA
ncbi:hypothetical protein BG58_16955 [Caballeronia jiangsuensis]|nr:hypothetical protein BG58_16955 [Caballeronia jiangsuensis]